MDGPYPVAYAHYHVCRGVRRLIAAAIAVSTAGKAGHRQYRARGWANQSVDERNGEERATARGRWDRIPSAAGTEVVAVDEAVGVSDHGREDGELFDCP